MLCRITFHISRTYFKSDFNERPLHLFRLVFTLCIIKDILITLTGIFAKDAKLRESARIICIIIFSTYLQRWVGSCPGASCTGSGGGGRASRRNRVPCPQRPIQSVKKSKKK